MTINTHACLQSLISLSAAVIFHTRSWLLMSKPFLQQHFQSPNFTTRTSLVPAPFKQTCPEIQVLGSWDCGDSPRAKCKVQGRWHLCLHRWGPGFGRGTTQSTTQQCTSTYLNCILSPQLVADKTVLRYWTSCSVWVSAEGRNAVVWGWQILAPLRGVERAVCRAAIWMLARDQPGSSGQCMIWQLQVSLSRSSTPP